MDKTYNKDNPEVFIKAVAIQATKYKDIFDKARSDCKHHTFNVLTENHNCYEGNIKTECNYILCPLKGE